MIVLTLFVILFAIVLTLLAGWALLTFMFGESKKERKQRLAPFDYALKQLAEQERQRKERGEPRYAGDEW